MTTGHEPGCDADQSRYETIRSDPDRNVEKLDFVDVTARMLRLLSLLQTHRAW